MNIYTLESKISKELQLNHKNELQDDTKELKIQELCGEKDQSNSPICEDEEQSLDKIELVEETSQDSSESGSPCKLDAANLENLEPTAVSLEDHGETDNSSKASTEIFDEILHDVNFSLCPKYSSTSYQAIVNDDELSYFELDLDDNYNHHQECQLNIDEFDDYIYTDPEDVDVGVKRSEYKSPFIDNGNSNSKSTIEEGELEKSEYSFDIYNKREDITSDIAKNVHEGSRDEDFQKTERKKRVKEVWKTILLEQSIDAHPFSKNFEKVFPGTQVPLTTHAEFLSPRILKRLANIFGHTSD